MASQMLKAKDEFHQKKKKRITTQIHCSKSPSKSSSPSRIKNVDFLEKVGALKTEKLPRQTAKDREGIKKNSVISPSGTPQKPWPGRKVTEMDETVKNMSNVPFYLQRMEKGDSAHEKALNVGVLEWGLLERWTHLQKCGTDARGDGDSSPLYQGKRSSVLARKNTTMMREDEVFRPKEGFSNSRFSSIMLPSHHLDVVFDPLGHKNDIDSEVMPELRLGSHSTTSPSRENTEDQGIWGFLQHSADGRQLCSGQSETSRKTNSGNLVEDFEIIYGFSEVPHSCPLPLASVNDELDVPCNVPSASCEKHESCTIQKPRKFEAKSIASAGKKSTVYPSSAGANRMSRSASLNAGSSEELLKSISFLYNSNGEQVTRDSKGSRQSPLRRLLDPIMKPRNNLHSTGKVAALPGRTDESSPGANKPLNISTRESVNGKKHAKMMKQALLHLAWRNGLPLFMLSSCDDEVLAAALTTTSTSNIDNLECMFTIFSINGSKKKSTFWHNSVNKCKQHQSISNVVGRVNVALGEAKSFPRDCFDSVREFVLLDASKPVDSPSVSELAAIVVQIPPSRKPNLRNVGGQSSVSVIIPSGIHGLAADGEEPSSLIERWRSGGGCDCGGWDEGCTLNILSDEFQEHNSCGSFQPCQTTDGTHRFELFAQGACRQTRQAFSMVCFKEGLYAVDFRSSMSLLQAFAICLAVIHGKKPYIRSTRRKSLQEHMLNDRLGKPSRYNAVPYHSRTR